MFTPPLVLQKSYTSLHRGPAFEIIQHIDFIANRLQKAALPVRPYTAQAVNTLIGLDEDRLLAIAQGLQSMRSILEGVDFPTGTVDEIALVKKALAHFKLKLKNCDWTATASDEIIEIYNADGIQLYRSLNFFRLCGYSLLDLCVNEWFILWERPRVIVEQMNEIIKDVLMSKKLDNKINIPAHVLRETYDDGTTQPFQPRSVMHKFLNIYPAYDDYDNIQGFVATSTADVIDIGNDALKINFI